MKKIFILIFILAIGIIFLVGCTTPVEPSNNQQQDDAPSEKQQNQRQAGDNEIPQPPDLPKQ